MMEVILVDLNEDVGIGTKRGGHVFTLRGEAKYASEKELKEPCVDELAQVGPQCVHVAVGVQYAQVIRWQTRTPAAADGTGPAPFGAMTDIKI
ncbi:hypothetical protein N7499_003981 [Penicillium canescens]|uniref:Uncharacterized protein n=1 Tax=Penicillium canescens TaxID=5083 RepID=A0AAD6INI2_PENCN|nr:uncharacterized protein N7446_007491 [Penicillium canescens]KAJ5991565.1 hypothetical protein N7522_011772 [Penicillium canescens]KAJ6049182.1 hypothetical protein N7444_005898 [Penicillium canescens]KAJ6052846.1 hypothetical protein N7460_003380 [Penicillium canescens]KAJ6063371.1 hypothetical protein N7446_007491 [Penicillium canescens]KAJ6089134.1 hypothetical protein N7499_003981 [Penicillium canescens]